MDEKICKICGDRFTPRSSRQTTCHHEKVKKCPVCGKEIRYICNNSNIPVTCSRSCASKYVKPGTIKRCTICDDEFVPKTPSQKYCGKTVQSTCEVCGKPITYHCGDTYVPTTCGSEECLATSKAKRSENKNETRTCPLCGRKFHPVNNTQKYCKHKHYFTCVVCGKKFYEPLEEIKLNNGIPRKTCSKECLSELHSRQSKERDNEEVNKKIRESCLKRFGVEHPAQSRQIQEKMRKTYQRNHPGYIHQSQNPTTRSKQAISRRTSKLELRICTLLENYNIHYVHRYMISNGVHSHEFDFYIPRYKILIDADGVYFHSYISDPDGNFVGDSYDPVRIDVVPKDHIFIVAVEGHEDKCIKEVHDIIKRIDSNAFNYETDMFKWCRKVGFPYPEYSNKRMKKDWNSLRSCHYSTYKPNAKLGISVIKNFHRSMYDCRVGNSKSVKEAWENDDLLKKVIENRLIYKNYVDPSKILSGFNISKICPIVSIFNPVLARYIVENYLSNFNEVFDPFSGFSGRMLGVASCDKAYIGQDLNRRAVEESNQIIDFLNLKKASVSCKDMLQSTGTYECLLTCPPYGKKETYSDETVFKSCDEWIDECLRRFNCHRYVFVVDRTEKYKDDIEFDINKNSHLYRTQEFVIVIDQ